MSVLSPPAAAAFSDQNMCRRTYIITPLATGVSLMPVRACGTIYHLTYGRTSATHNSADSWKHICLDLTYHNILWLFVGGTRGVQVKLWEPLRTRAIPERLRGVITTRRYTNPYLPLPLPLFIRTLETDTLLLTYWLCKVFCSLVRYCVTLFSTFKKRLTYSSK